MRYNFFVIAVAAAAAGCVEVHIAIFTARSLPTIFDCMCCTMYTVHRTSAIGAIAENCNNWMNVC